MGEHAYGDVVCPGFCISADIFKLYTSGDLDGNAARVGADSLYGSTRILHGHIVEQHSFCAVGQSFFQFSRVADLDFQGLFATTVFQGFLESGCHTPSDGNVIVLDQDAVGEIKPVIVAAAAAHGILVEHAKTGHGFARIQDPGARTLNCIHKLACKRGYSAESLEDIQDHPFARKQDARVVANHGDRLASAHTDAIENFSVADHFRMADGIPVQTFVNFQDAGDYADSGQNAVLLGQNGGGGALMRINAGARGGVAGSFVLQQRVFENGGNSAALPVHILSS